LALPGIRIGSTISSGIKQGNLAVYQGIYVKPKAWTDRLKMAIDKPRPEFKQQFFLPSGIRRNHLSECGLYSKNDTVGKLWCRCLTPLAGFTGLY